MNRAPLFGSAEALAAKRILIINVTRIGDTLLNTPAIRAIAQHFPNAAITCLGHAKRVEVLQHLPYLAKVGGIDKKSARYRGRLGSLTGDRYDWAFVWGNDDALHRYALRKSDRVVGYVQRDSSLNQQLFHAADEPALYSLHGVAMQLALPLSVGIAANGYALDYVVTADETAAARATLQADLPANKKPIIGLQVASFPTKAYRDWPIEQFIALAVRILKSHPNAHFLLFGGTDDQPRTKLFADILPDNTIDYAGNLGLRKTVAVMKEIDLYIGVDTGPTHMYGSLSQWNKPMVSMYHPTLPSALYKPLQHPALYVVDHPLAGMTKDESIPMSDISVETVWERVSDALEGVPSRFSGMLPVGVRL